MIDPIVAPSAPATIEVVAMKVAEQLMSDMHGRIAELQTRLDLVEREASEADRHAETAHGEGPTFAEVAGELLARAEDLRTTARTLAQGPREPDQSGEARILRLPTTSDEPPQGSRG